MDCQVARVVYGKATEDQTIEAAAHDFVVGLNAELGEAGEPLVENPWADAKPAAVVEQVVDHSAILNVVQYDDMGNVTHGDLRKVIEMGVKPGVRLQREEEDGSSSTVEVTSVGRDGSITGVAVAEDGSSTRTTCNWSSADILRSKLTTWRAEFLENWMTTLSPASNDPINCRCASRLSSWRWTLSRPLA